MSKDKPPRAEIPRGEDEDAGDSQSKRRAQLVDLGHREAPAGAQEWEIHLRPKPLEEER